MSFTTPELFTTRPTLRGSFGMAASTHWLASQSAMAVLERGGNAFDAAVAGGLVLQVVEPHLNGPGGDLVGLVAPVGQETRVLAGLGAAPRGASVDHYLSLGLTAVPGSGFLAATAPGAVDAWLLLLRDHGSWEPTDVASFALHYAETGYPVLPRVTSTIEAVAELFAEQWPTSAEVWLPGGTPLAEGTMHTQPAWAATLRRLLDAAQGDSREERIDGMRREWREGFVADAIARFVETPLRDSSGSDHAGIITREDIADYSAAWEQPVGLDFRGTTVLKAGAWTQGPVLLQALALLDGMPEEALDPSTGFGAHTILEALKLALADRDAWYGDDGSTPLDVLLSAEYAASRRTLISDFASSELRPGAPEGREPRIPGTTSEAEADLVGAERGDTTHIDVVDQWGNLVSITPSGGWLQSSPFIPELGFCLGTRLQMTWLEEGQASTLRPGQRPRTTLSPTVLVRDGRAAVALGTPGGDKQDQWQLPFLLRYLVGGYELQQAIDAPTFHTTSANESFWPRERVPGGAVVEDRLGDGVIAELIVRGHDVTVSGPWSLGRLSAVSRDGDGNLAGAANPRGAQGYAVGR